MGIILLSVIGGFLVAGALTAAIREGKAPIGSGTIGQFVLGLLLFVLLFGFGFHETIGIGRPERTQAALGGMFGLLLRLLIFGIRSQHTSHSATITAWLKGHASIAVLGAMTALLCLAILAPYLEPMLASINKITTPWGTTTHRLYLIAKRQ